MKEHIVSTYDDDLNTLKTKLLEMGVLVERQIFQAIEITKIINLAKAKKIQKGDDAIDSLEVEIREFATKTLTKRQPLADDLRKIINKYGRIGIGAGSIFVYKGKRKAVLVNYPDKNDKQELFSDLIK